jgi:glycosyltransferase involved in cell wall biosynthesis
MRIGIDGYIFGSKLKAGIFKSTVEILKGLSVLDSENKYTLYIRNATEIKLPSTNKNIDIKYVLCPSFSMLNHDPFLLGLWLPICMPIELSLNKVDVYFSSHAILPFRCPCKTVITVPDVAYLFDKRYFSSGARQANNIMTSWAIHHADKIIAISESTKRDLIQYCSINPSKISVVYRSYDSNRYRQLSDISDINTIKKTYGLQEYILYVGTLEPRKNIIRLIKAYNVLKHSMHINYKLVICGAKGWMYNNIFKLVYELGFVDDVIFTGYISDDEIPILMNGACLLIYPSLYEGFGRPPLEAMACGTPVIVSNISSMPEVVGDAGALVDPTDVDDIANTILAILTNDKIRKEMAEKGLERAKLFSTEKMIQNTINIFNELK